MNKKWNRDALYRLLRFGRKNEGGWTDIDIDWNDGETIPDDNDIDLLMAAPLMYEALEKVYEAHGDGEFLDDIIDEIRAALQAAKGGEDA